MNHEARCAFVHAQAVCALAEIAGMQAENAIAQAEGADLPYRKTDFDAVQRAYTIAHNDVIEYLRS